MTHCSPSSFSFFSKSLFLMSSLCHNSVSCFFHTFFLRYIIILSRNRALRICCNNHECSRRPELRDAGLLGEEGWQCQVSASVDTETGTTHQSGQLIPPSQRGLTLHVLPHNTSKMALVKCPTPCSRICLSSSPHIPADCSSEALPGSSTR